MREIVFDTETTGLDPETGDRVVEIGAVELWNHVPTGRTYHQYINPQRAMTAEAFEVHGIGADLLDPPQKIEPGGVALKDKPPFAKIIDAFLDFIGDDATLIAHNASFDMRFINAELRWANRGQISNGRVLDTLVIARRKFPGSPASLDALCRRFSIDNSDRTLHGALLDSEILAEVYLELIGGRQPGLTLDAVSTDPTNTGPSQKIGARPQPLAPRISEKEKAAHEAFVASLGDTAVWNRFQ